MILILNAITFTFVCYIIHIANSEFSIKSRTYKLIEKYLNTYHPLHQLSNCMTTCENKTLLYIALNSNIDNEHIINLVDVYRLNIKSWIWVDTSNDISNHCDELLSLYNLNSFDHIYINRILEVSNQPWSCVKKAYDLLVNNGRIVIIADGMQPMDTNVNYRFLPGGIKAIGEYAGFNSLYVDGYSSRSLTRAMWNGTIDVNSNSMEALSFDSSYYEDQNFYMESWYIGGKKIEQQSNYNSSNNHYDNHKNILTNNIKNINSNINNDLTRKLNKIPICERCKEFTGSLGPPMLLFLNISKQIPRLSWDNNNMEDHVILQPKASCRSKATRISTERYFVDKISKYHSKNNQKILEVSPPSHNGIECWGKSLVPSSTSNSNNRFAKTIFNYNIFESCESLPFKDNQFDQVWVNFVLEHSIQPWICMIEFYRVLKPNGALMIAVPAFYHLHTVNYPDNYRYTPRGLQQLASFANFSVIETDGWGRLEWILYFIEDSVVNHKRSTVATNIMNQPNERKNYFVSWLYALK